MALVQWFRDCVVVYLEYVKQIYRLDNLTAFFERICPKTQLG